MAWAGAQQAAARIGAGSSLVAPRSMLELTAAPEAAAAQGASVVVTVGPEVAPAVLAAARAHPQTEFIEIDQTVPADAPANLHGLVFDEAEAGYLAGFAAASMSESGSVGMVGDAASDTRTNNYLAGFQAGAVYADPKVKVSVAYAGNSISPDKGRSASATLVKGGADVVLALPSLSGIGAMRDACGRKAIIVAADTDAWALVPDVQKCVAVSVRKRFDLAVGDAIGRLNAGETLPATTLADVAGGAIDLTDFHVDVPADLPGRLFLVLAAMESQPPRSTPTPQPTPTPATQG
jgi:basic membrane protein A